MRAMGCLAALALAGCVSVSAHKAPGANLSQYRTFNFYTPPESATRQIAFEGSLAGQATREQLRRNLAAKGFVEVSEGATADLTVAYHSRTQEKLQYTDWGYPAGWGYGGPYGGFYPGPIDVSTYTEGTIVVDLIDARTQRVVWRGSASSVVYHPENPDPKKVASAVDKLMKRVQM